MFLSEHTSHRCMVPTGLPPLASDQTVEVMCHADLQTVPTTTPQHAHNAPLALHTKPWAFLHSPRLQGMLPPRTVAPLQHHPTTWAHCHTATHQPSGVAEGGHTFVGRPTWGRRKATHGPPCGHNKRVSFTPKIRFRRSHPRAV